MTDAGCERYVWKKLVSRLEVDLAQPADYLTAVTREDEIRVHRAARHVLQVLWAFSRGEKPS